MDDKNKIEVGSILYERLKDFHLIEQLTIIETGLYYILLHTEEELLTDDISNEIVQVFEDIKANAYYEREDYIKRNIINKLKGEGE